MPQLSVVIITKNETVNIIDCIKSAKKISNDIIVVDSGSTDGTALLARSQRVRVHSIDWQGYGHARNTGAAMAANNWILSLDADERITEGLASEILALPFANDNIVYGFRRLNFFSGKKIRFGALAHDRVFRLYNRIRSTWNLVPVHEKLINIDGAWRTLSFFAIHFGIRDAIHYKQKKIRYAFLCALKYQQKRKRFIRLFALFAPAFNFSKSYLFQLGFLDGHYGFTIAKINADYTRKKYQHLQVLIHASNQRKTADVQPTFARAHDFFLKETI